MEIKIPFREDMALAVVSGAKVCTSRTKRYGTAGEYFKVTWEGLTVEMELERTEKRTLSYVAMFLFAAEGFDSPKQFIDVWNEIHPLKRFDPKQKVWVHWFERVR